MAARQRIALIGNAASWHARELLQRCRGRSIGSLVTWPELAGFVDGSGERFRPAAVAAADTLLVRGMPAGSLEQVIGRMDMLGRLAACGRRVVNPPAALEVAIDKYLATARLAAAGLPVVPSALVQSPGQLEQAREALGSRLIGKPLFGGNGRGICRIDPGGGLPEFLGSQGAVLVQREVPHAGWDVRVLIVGERAFSMRRIAPAGEWITNLSLGGTAASFTPPSEWIDIAQRAARTLATEIAGVDLLPGLDGSLQILEVNAVPGWRALQTVVAEDIATAVLEQAIGRKEPRPSLAPEPSPAPEKQDSW